MPYTLGYKDYQPVRFSDDISIYEIAGHEIQMHCEADDWITDGKAKNTQAKPSKRRKQGKAITARQLPDARQVTTAAAHEAVEGKPVLRRMWTAGNTGIPTSHRL